jgi:hypothetical protein
MSYSSISWLLAGNHIASKDFTVVLSMWPFCLQSSDTVNLSYALLMNFSDVPSCQQTRKKILCFQRAHMIRVGPLCNFFATLYNHRSDISYKQFSPTFKGERDYTMIKQVSLSFRKLKSCYLKMTEKIKTSTSEITL